MNSIFKRLTLLLILAGLFVVPGLAQTDITTTTLAAATTNSSRIVVVGSNTGITVGDWMVVDREFMDVRAINGTAITVVRGIAGTLADNHANSVLVYHEVPSAFISTDLYGGCTAGAEFPNFEPLINPRTGNSFVCSGGSWYKSELGVQVASAGISITAATTLISGQCGQTIFVNNATGFEITLPVPTAGCYFKFYDATLVTSGNHTIVTNGSDNIIIGSVSEGEVTTNTDAPVSTVGDIITTVGSADSLGDWIELISDGTSWFLAARCQLVGGITIGST